MYVCCSTSFGGKKNYLSTDSSRPPQVQGHLESSKYHHHQTQQVKQYLTLGSKLGSQAHPVAHPYPGQALGTVPIMRNGHMPPVTDSSTPGSPVTLLTLANNHDDEVSVISFSRHCLLLCSSVTSSIQH